MVLKDAILDDVRSHAAGPLTIALVTDQPMSVVERAFRRSYMRVTQTLPKHLARTLRRLGCSASKSRLPRA
jgi:hypothetical protein